VPVGQVAGPPQVDEQVVGHAHATIIPGRTHRAGSGTNVASRLAVV
jgi:hypothetical protein